MGNGRMRYLDLFSGCGGVACGLAESGWTCVAAADVDKTACALYSANFPTHPVECRDLATSPIDVNIADGVLIGGPPCQDFSAATRSPPTDRPRAALTSVFVEHATRLQPRFVVYENVPRAASSMEFKMMVDALVAHGYTVHYETVCVARLGMAQNRRRLILLASRNADEVRAAWSVLRAQFCQKAASMRECFAAAGVHVETQHVYIAARDPRHRRSVYSLEETAPTVRCSLRPFRPRYEFTARDSAQSRDEVVSLTTAHVAALQGFPSWYVWSGTKTAQARCIGNAVPPPLAAAIARAIDAACNAA